jgi:hypothetical protein
MLRIAGGIKEPDWSKPSARLDDRGQASTYSTEVQGLPRGAREEAVSVRATEDSLIIDLLEQTPGGEAASAPPGRLV